MPYIAYNVCSVSCVLNQKCLLTWLVVFVFILITCLLDNVWITARRNYLLVTSGSFSTESPLHHWDNVSNLTSKVKVSSLLSPQGTQCQANEYQCCSKECSCEWCCKVTQHHSGYQQLHVRIKYWRNGFWFKEKLNNIINIRIEWDSK